MNAYTMPSKHIKPVVFLRPDSLPNPRVMRNIRAVREIGLDVVFVGAKRAAELPRQDTWEDVPIRRIGIGYELVGRRRPLTFLWGLFCFVVAAHGWLFWNRPRIVHASNVEGILACVFYKLCWPWAKIVYNIHDNLHERYRVSRWMRFLLLAVEASLARIANTCLLPDESRVRSMGAWAPRRVEIIPNTPEDPGLRSLPESSVPPLRLLLMGQLDWDRGVKTAAKLLETMPDLCFEAAGTGPPDVLDFISSLPRTTFHGWVTQTEVFEIASRCHLILAFYDPRMETNRNACPNKFGDALAIGRPLLINNEARPTAELVTHNCAMTAPYGQPEAIVLSLQECIRSPEKLAELSRNARLLYERRYDWRIYKPRVQRVFAKLAGMEWPEDLHPSADASPTRRAA